MIQALLWDMSCVSPHKTWSANGEEWEKKVSPEGQVFKGEGKRVLHFLADLGRGKGKMKRLEK